MIVRSDRINRQAFVPFKRPKCSLSPFLVLGCWFWATGQLVSICVGVLIGAGCAWVTHEQVKYHPYPSPPADKNDQVAKAEYEADYKKAGLKNQEEDKKHTGGVRYYLSSPYLLVYTNGKGKLLWQIEYLPDPTKLMVGTPTQFFAKTTSKFAFTNGILSSSKNESDSTAAPKAIIAAVEKTLPLLAAAFTDLKDTGTKKIPAPRLYKIVLEQDNFKLIGVQSSEQVNVTLTAGYR